MKTNVNPEIGLSHAQVEMRMAEGKVNSQPPSKTKTVGKIVWDNTFTLFNILNAALALMIVFVRSYENLLFIMVVIVNTFIGIIQEMKAKRMIDKLTLMTEPHATVRRDGDTSEIEFDKIVIDDVLVLVAGKQIPSDSQVLAGELEVNESLLTGESDSVIKRVGDTLLSGSFVVAGEATVQVTEVGAGNYATKLSAAVKVVKKPHSEIMKALNFILKGIGYFILPIGMLLFHNHISSQQLSFQDAVTKSVAGIIGMIPEGLVLLTGVALAVGVIRLGAHKVLIQESYCIEALARVDELCLDKTGTITEGNLEVLSVETMGYGKNPIRVIRAMLANIQDDNPTYRALRECCKGEAPKWQCERVISFSSARKWWGASFAEQGSFVMGAPEYVLGERYEEIREKVEAYAHEGNRVVILGHSPDHFNEAGDLPQKIETIALLPMGDKIRPEAKKTLEFFRDQGVEIKVISGDNPITVSQIAKRAGLANWNNFVDASTLTEADDLRDAAQAYSVFGRVSPEQKCALIRALKDQGHTVAMTGDGVNDILALREADCSIAMAQGSDAVRQISQLVLLDSDFSNLTRVVMEGRRVINNITQTASLFLVKTIFSFLLAVIIIARDQIYPFMPIQLSLLSVLLIGVPSVFLSLEPNKKRVKGNLLETIFKNALPGALTVVVCVLLIVLVGDRFQLSHPQISTLSVMVTGLISLRILFRVCRPFTMLHGILFLAVTAAFMLAVLAFEDMFFLVSISSFLPVMLIILSTGILSIYPLMRFFAWIVNKAGDALVRWKRMWSE